MTTPSDDTPTDETNADAPETATIEPSHPAPAVKPASHDTTPPPALLDFMMRDWKPKSGALPKPIDHHDAFHARQTVEFYNALFEPGLKQKPKPQNIEMHIYGNGQHAGAISPRKGIPFGTWHHRLVDWAVDLNLMPVPKPQDAAAGGAAGR